MMEVGDELASGLYKPRLEDEGQRQLGGRGTDNSAPSLNHMDVHQCQTVGDMDDSCIRGASGSGPAEGVDCGGAGAACPSPEIDLKVDVEVKMRTEELRVVKRRRGRPPRGQQKSTPLPRKCVTKDEEDVCFICFDGGSLVLCDRRGCPKANHPASRFNFTKGCPKAYHPACIKRDDAFFQSKAKWNCGWHICSSCRKASHYMCYTCTFSLCKGCIKDADYRCVRGSKGLCGTCMRTIILLEKSLLGNSNVVPQVDFDDRSSWEYLFKIYWVYLKQKLSLTLDELARAKNPWKGGWTINQKGGVLGKCCDANDSKSGGSDIATKGMEAANFKRKAIKSQQNFSCKVGFLIENLTDDKMITSTEGKVWATNELLAFVAHMRNGDMSELSQFDAESLVLEYIKENNLRDPQQKSQIICDPMLTNLFGKQRVGHFEMLKLLEYHLLSKESSSSANRNSKVLDVPDGLVEVKENFSCQSITDGERKHSKRKKADVRKQQTNPDEYAAIKLPSVSNRIEHLTNDTDMEMMWHYQDPAGNVQGPFSMAQLHKWSSSGHFPFHLRVWKISEMPTDSILLTDALMAQESKKSLLRYKNQVLSAIGLCSDDGEDHSSGEWSRNLRTNESGSPPALNRPADVVNSSECQPKSLKQRTANKDSTAHHSQVRELSISPTLSAQPLQFSNQIGEVYRGEKTTGPTLGNQSSCKSISVEANSGQSCEKRSDSDGCSGQSSGQNWRPLLGNATQDSTDGVISSAKSTEQRNCDLDFPDFTSPIPKAGVGFTGQAAEIKQSALSGVLIQDSVPSWSTGSSLVGGRKQLPDVTGVWGVFLTAPTNASTEERDSSLITAATPGSVNDQFTHPSPSHPTSNVSDWQEIIETDEFNSLEDESLSDLLAEVEAMESLSELASSASVMNCREDLTHGCRIDCFSPIRRSSPKPEMGKGDALSSTRDVPVQSESTITDEPHLRLHVFDIDPQMKSACRSAMSADVDINKKYNDVTTNQWKDGTVLQNLTHFSAALNMNTAENTWRIGSEATWGNADLGWGGLNKGNPSVNWEIRHDSIQEMESTHSGTSAGNNTTNWYGQPKCSLNLLPSP